ncbi:esterase-like activity of phytase family protein [Sphingomonas sp. Tas61C01]|uniref:esterase-like activity of phytase family protein n=1 Tax=Sphingomonas sp. Tas61C01 TaxID=3458297 RepID=UPI00403EC135
MRLPLIALLASAALVAPASAATLVSQLTVANGTDLSGLAGVGQNRLGGFGSDLVYNAVDGLFYGMSDRGPGGGVLSYAPRIQAFSLAIDSATGALGSFTLEKTLVFTRADGSTYNGLNPQLLNGSKATLGGSLDPEGLALLPNGHFLVSDEYGPSINEFDAGGALVRTFATPANLVPKTSGGTTNYVDGRPTITSGRQDNRGFEGLTLSPDGKTAYAVLQDPLVNEGRANNGNADGRFSRNVRIVAYDVATGESTGQYIYQLEALADINDRVTGDFDANSQGRSIGVSAIQALGNGKFLVLERDNRGLSVDGTVSTEVSSKRIYQIDLTGATDVAAISLAGRNDLPAGVKAATKTTTPYIDIAAAMRAMGYQIPEKIEGFTFGPRLADGGITLIVATDNDFSVTQNGDGTQFDVCVDAGNTARVQVGLGAGCPTGYALIPNTLLSFRLSAAEYGQLIGAVPEPTTWGMMVVGFGATGAALRRRRRRAAVA